MRTGSLIATALLLLASCNSGSDSSPTGPDTIVPFVTVHREQITGVAQRRAELISRQDLWEKTWAEIVSNRFPKPPIPTVDFDRNLLIFVALGETPDSCKSVRIDDVRRRASGELLVSVKETRPPPSCSCPPVVAFPVHVVAVPRSATGVAFTFESVTEGPGCN